MISEDVDYSIRIIRAMFNNGENNSIDAKTISKSEDIPILTLYRLLRKLCANNILTFNKEDNKKYMLNVSLDTISLRTIVEAIDGKIYINKCTRYVSNCSNCLKGCKINHELLEIEKEIYKLLSRKSIRQILE
ncbi:Rrf2 family transcriptional regulator [Clostridioides sp. ZZV15-6383]|uniref:RrF2 family transcriptional regulator n=1 Tax=Clostridioides sp. ZZV15-6383 TaxID=2811498 RepID=UPI001D0F8C42|nr:Rrf2 family transcriptional regulator [Clostridioides sp. ZZV15-6383]